MLAHEERDAWVPLDVTDEGIVLGESFKLPSGFEVVAGEILDFAATVQLGRPEGCCNGTSRKVKSRGGLFDVQRTGGRRRSVASYSFLPSFSCCARPFRGSFVLLRRMNYKDFASDFDQPLRAVRREVQVELQQGAPAADTFNARLAEVSPRSAVIEARRQIEEALMRAAKHRNLDFIGRDAGPSLPPIRVLQRAENVDAGTIGILHQLRTLRNNAAHNTDFAVSRNSAAEYAGVASTVVDHLDSIQDAV